MFKWNAYSMNVLVWCLTKISTGFSLAYFFLITVCCCPWISKLAASHKMLQMITPCCHQTAQHILPAVPSAHKLFLALISWYTPAKSSDIEQGQFTLVDLCVHLLHSGIFQLYCTGQWRKDMKHTLSSIVEVKVRPSTCSAEELWISGCKRNSTS